MEEHNYRIDFISKIFKRKIFQFNNELSPTQNFEFKYRVTNIDDIKMMIYTGDFKPTIFLEVEIFDLNPATKKMVNILIKDFPPKTVINVINQLLNFELKNEINNKIILFLKAAIGFEGGIMITNYKIKLDKEENITETRAHRLPIQKMVKDVVTILKTNQDGEFYLPEDINDEMVYNFTGVKDISVELTVRKDSDIKRFAVNGSYNKDQDVIEVLIVINPNENINKLLYDVIGELNDLFAHELEHYRQYTKGEFELEGNEGIEDPLIYYTRPEEIKAQLKGFKRLSKMRRIPLEVTIRNWFETHKDIHHLSNNDKETVIDTLLQHS